MAQTNDQKPKRESKTIKVISNMGKDIAGSGSGSVVGSAAKYLYKKYQNTKKTSK